MARPCLTDRVSRPREEFVALLEGSTPAGLPDTLRAVPLGNTTAIVAPIVERTAPRGLPARGKGSPRRIVAETALMRQRRLEALPADRAVLPCAPGTPVPPRLTDLAIANADVVSDAFGRVRGRDQYQIVVTASRDAPDGLAGAVQNMAACALIPLADDAIVHPIDSTTLLNASLLVAKDRAADVDSALERIDALWPEGLRIRLIGPGPAVSFALARVTLVPLAAGRAAARLLGLEGDRLPIPDHLRALRRDALKRAGMAAGIGRGDPPSPADVDAAVAVVSAMSRIAAAHGGRLPAAFDRIPLLAVGREAPSAAQSDAASEERVA